MEIIFKCLSLLSVFLMTAASTENYALYDLSSINMCGHGQEKSSLFIGPWKAAIVKFGHPNATIASPFNRDLHECTVSVKSPEGFGLAAVIEEMRIQGSVDKETNAWNCDGDYVQLSTAGSTFISKILDLLPGDVFKNKKTEQLCGIRAKRNLFTEVGSNANVLSTLADNLEVFFHQSKRRSVPINNYFQIVITTFKHIREAVFTEDCQGQYKCLGMTNYCVGRVYRCDGHPNCAFPGGGGDEVHCNVGRIYHPIFSTTTTIITVLAAIVGAGLVFGILLTLFRKLRSRAASRTEGVVGGGRGVAAAPPIQRQHTLPPYEAVVMADIGKNSAPPSPSAPDFPPSYDTLFPDGYPNHTTPDRSPESPSTGQVHQEEPSQPT